MPQMDGKTSLIYVKVRLDFPDVKDFSTNDFIAVHFILKQLVEIERSVYVQNMRHMKRAVLALPKIRKSLNLLVVLEITRVVFGGKPNSTFFTWQKLLDEMKLRAFKQTFPSKKISFKQRFRLSEESKLYVFLLVFIFLIDTKTFSLGLFYGNRIVELLFEMSRRSLDPIAAKCYFYYSKIYELVNPFDNIRTVFHERLQTAVIKNQFETTAVLLNCLLRNYLHYNLYSQAEKLAYKTIFPREASNDETAKYLYYVGRIKAVKLEYPGALRTLQQALVKAPDSAIGFKQTVVKLTILVELLLGEIPNVSVFSNPKYRVTLLPYYHLVRAMYNGDLSAFETTLFCFREVYVREKNLCLALRVHKTVLRSVLKRIGLMYTRISLTDVANCLLLNSPFEAEYVVAKAICDGNISGEIVRHEGYVKLSSSSTFSRDGNSLEILNSKILDCLDVYRSIMMSMEYPATKRRFVARRRRIKTYVY